jgi:hypothetical protein
MRCLLFTSAGDRAIIDKYWVGADRKYDIFLCYYGNKTDKPLLKFTDYYAERKGSKFQNFYSFWQNQDNNSMQIIQNNPDKPKFNIKKYDYYFIVDDDIIISTSNINKLFKIISRFELDIIQPSFILGQSQISHPITVSRNNSFMRYTNFIEVNTPVFNKIALERCMQIYDPILVGYGIDYLFIWVLGQNNQNKYAIVDTIKCINPICENREINVLQSFKDRVKNWLIVSKKYNIITWEHKTFNTIPLNFYTQNLI